MTAMRPTLMLTVTGDAGQITVEAGAGGPLAMHVGDWARRVSHQPPAALLLLAGDRLLDPDRSPAELGLPDGTAIRLVTGDEAMAFLNSRADGERSGHGPWQPTTPPPPPDGTAYITPPLTSPSQPRRPPPPDAVPVTDYPPPSSHQAPPEEPPVPPAAPHPAPADAQGRQAPAPAAPTDEDLLPGRVPGSRRFWAALRASMSRKSATPHQSGAFAKATVPGAGERYRLALQSTDRLHNLETMVRAAFLPRCVVISVVSPKGGPGKTTMTALLGTLLAELRRDPVVALDANPDLGDLRDKLSDGTTPAAYVDDLARWLDEHPGVAPADLAARLGTGPHGLRFIPTPRPPVCTKERMIDAADFHLYERLIARLRDYEGIILVDCGTGLLDPPVRAALEAADQVVLVTDSSATTARQVVAAAGLLPDDTPTWLVANKMPQKGSMLDLDQVVAAMPGLRGVTVMPVPEGGQLAENVVTSRFDWATAPVVWREPIRELAARLALDWRTLG